MGGPRDGRIELRDVLRSAFRVGRRLRVDEWAETYRVLTQAESAAPGPWRNEITPYLVEPMASLTDPSVSEVVLVFPAQVGKTEVGINWIGWIIHEAPGPVMVLRPTLDDCEGFTRQRLKHLFSLPSVRDLVAQAKSKDEAATVLLREFTGGLVILSGANAPTRLAAWPIRYLFADEVDRYPESAGTEGDPLELARRRLSAFGARSKQLVCSTPTVKGKSRLEREWAVSSQADWEVPCPRCKKYQRLIWREEDGTYRLVWQGDPWTEDRLAVWYVCRHCGYQIPEDRKAYMLSRGRWRHAHPERMVRGYRLNALSAPPGWISWSDLVREWTAAIERQRAGDTTALQVFVNTRLADWWEDVGEQIEVGGLEARVEEWDRLPERVRVVTAGVDVQENRIECEVVAWGPGQESWSLAYHIVDLDPLDPGAWEALDRLLSGTFETEDGRTLGVSVTAVDSGFRTQQVLEYCATRYRERRLAIKGIAGAKPIWDRRPRRGRGKSNRVGIFYLVGTDTAKDVIHAHLRIHVPGPGYCHFHKRRLREVPDYFLQLASERRVRVKDKSGRIRWRWEVISERRRNECLDCRVYALAALHAWLALGNSLSDKPVDDKPVEAKESRPATIPTSRAPRQKVGGRQHWFDRRQKWF